MPKKYDDCVRNVRRKIKQGKQPKTYKCTKDGKPSKRGSKRCKTNPYAVCSRLRPS